MKDEMKKMWIADNGDGTYSNPILYTDYSDPDAIRVGEDYFMVASSYCNDCYIIRNVFDNFDICSVGDFSTVYMVVC